MKLLGQIISHDLIEMDNDKIRILLDWPVPKDVLGLQEFLGLANYNRNKIIMFAKHAGPLYELLKLDEPFDMNTRRLEAFSYVKALFKEFP